jgi:hypothetical protein
MMMMMMMMTKLDFNIVIFVLKIFESNLEAKEDTFIPLN